MTDLGKLKFTRGLIKSKVTRLQTHVNNLNLQELDDKSISQLKLRASKFENVLDEFNSVQNEIEFAIENEEPDERNIFEKNYYDLNSKMDEIISNYYKNQTVSPISLGPSSNETVSAQQIKLPMINLPTFDGNSGKWLEFRDAFKSLIHDNNSITTIQKFYYLRSSLRGEAEEVIQSMKITDANYSSAWQLLQECYENKRLVVHNHIKAMFQCPQLKKERRVDLRCLHNTIMKNLRSLETMGQPTDNWDALIVYLITSKFDDNTMQKWESWEIEGELPTLDDVTKFIKKRCEVLEKLETRSENDNKNDSQRASKGYNSSYNKPKSQLVSYASSSLSCYYCQKAHTIYNCESFSKLPVNSRIQEIKQLRLCVNCLRPSHTAQMCSGGNCRKCGKRHNSLLHLEKNNATDTESGNQENKQVETTKAPTNDVTVVSHTRDSVGQSQVLLSTALILVENEHKQVHQCRALLDSGSQSNFISKEFCKRLGLNSTSTNISISGVGQTTSTISEQVSIKIMSRRNSYNKIISALVIPKITENLPILSFSCEQLNIPDYVKLADPKFNESGSIDMLLGSNVFWEILCVGQVKLNDGMPILHKTLLGWVVAGNLNYTQSRLNKSINCLNIKCNNIQLDDQLKRFWQVEEVNNLPILSNDEKTCESHFKENTERDNEGRFIVRMPLKANTSMLGESRQAALERFISLEKRLAKNNKLRQEYTTFMTDYETLGHMSPIDEGQGNNDVNYYIPHHAVIKEQGTTSKIRVVFDASMKTDIGVSLNDIQYCGPTIQSDLISILLRFRIHEYVMTADISKMYRQVLINPDQRHLLRIFWRADPTASLKCYNLNTVTYGTTSAPYLAVRCLQAVANEYETIYPQASKIIKHDFYVDDLLTGSNSAADLVRLQGEISSILNSARFELRKWSCNKPELINKFQINRDLEVNVIELGEDQNNKTLGIFWNPNFDTIQYSINESMRSNNVTKRTILSITAQIFDPLGLLGPIIVIAKILIQKLWLANLTWDETIPQVLHSQWCRFLVNLQCLNDIKIPRYVLSSNYDSIELHAFCDASEHAYGACVYIRCKTKKGTFVTNLLCAKSRVAPVKQISLPRLELCGAVLLANLVKKVKTATNIQFNKIYYYCDSTITLHWIKGTPNKWKTFVANRTSEIQQLSNFQDWYHVNSSENPADIISRGTDADTLLKSELWWKGPAFLLQDSLNLQSENHLDDIPEQRLVANVAVNDQKSDLFDKYSSWTRLQRVTAYCLRFISNLKSSPNERMLGQLSTTELQYATRKLITLCQYQSLFEDYTNLTNNKPIGKSSKLLCLNPFLENKIMRVGGRIRNSNFNFDKKFPIILPRNHNLTKLLMRHEHHRLFHCGPSMLLASVREQYWPIAGRNLARDIVNKCVICFKNKPKNIQYLMGDLPASRTTQTVPFHNSGVDYAGPLLIRDKRTRGAKISKAYVCLFICLATKAIHLELVSDLSTDSFLACLRRFIARRGKPAMLLSDNGTNFVGANSKLQELHKFLKLHENEIINSMANDKITWKFIPPQSPSFGGIYEAGIKSMKYHLRRVMGTAHLTFEELYTVLAQIESILNSRPLCPLSSNPDDPTPLTPAHFLIGRSLTAIPEQDVREIPENRLKHYERLQQILQHFWARWNKEYVSQLQTRVKWRQNFQTLLKKGSIVLIKEDNTPPLCWKLGVVSRLHTGADGTTRVVTVRVNNSEVKRSVAKLCSLPIPDND